MLIRAAAAFRTQTRAQVRAQTRKQIHKPRGKPLKRLPQYKSDEYYSNPPYAAELREALAEIERGECKTFDTIEELFADWDADDAEDDDAYMTVIETAGYRRDLRRMKKQGKNIQELKAVVAAISRGEALSPKYRDHWLNGGAFEGCRECHVQPDWLLVYKINNRELELILLHTGSHSNLF